MSSKKQNQQRSRCFNPKHNNIVKDMVELKAKQTLAKKQRAELETAHCENLILLRDANAYVGSMERAHKGELKLLKEKHAGKVSLFAALALVLGILIGANV